MQYLLQLCSRTSENCVEAKFGPIAPLQPVSKLAEDPTRQHIDSAICEAIGLPEDPIVALRGILGSEPRFAQIKPKRRVLEQLAEVQQPLF